MRILSEERYSEIKKIINQAGNSTQRQLADQAKTCLHPEPEGYRG